MEKNEKEKEWKTISKKFQESNTKVSDDDINNLNEDNSFSPVDEVEEKVPLTEEEKKAIRKKLFILLIVIIVVIIGLIAVRMINPVKKHEPSNIQKEDEEEIDEETQVEDDTTPILELKDGEISEINNELITLIDEIEYETGESYLNAAKELYKSGNTDIKTASDECKLLLVSKTKEFGKLASEKMLIDFLNQKDIQIEVKEIDTILNERFNTKVNVYKDFIYLLSSENNKSSVVKFSKNGNIYTGVMANGVEIASSRIDQKFVSATKKENKIYIDMKVVFIKENGVYKDSNFTSLIINDKQTTEDEYFKEANTYRYTYDIIDKNYVLTNVSLVK